jgi:hypothetical protein
MKDVSKMASKDKRFYIFEDTSFEGRTRSKWITDCLLGDIRTFLDGIENFTDNQEKFAFKPLPRGGGNLSAPILINTALEFVAALNAGMTEYIDKNKYKGSKHKYIGDFIEDFFPDAYGKIPILLWEGVRNGLVHTFYSKAFEYNGRRIQFQFFVENRNVPSHIKKNNNTIVISINIFELYRILEKAIEYYCDRLKDDDTLQNKFIEAWSSIEEDSQENIDNNTEISPDAKELIDYLGSSSDALLFEDLNKMTNMDVLRIYTLMIRRS